MRSSVRIVPFGRMTRALGHRGFLRPDSRLVGIPLSTGLVQFFGGDHLQMIFAQLYAAGIFGL